MMEDEEKRDEETYAIIGAAMEVHRRLSSGFLEAVYQEALALEFESAGIPFKKEEGITIQYKDHKLQNSYRADFICFDSIIVELKALSELTKAHYAQVIHYLKATGFHRALLLNFGAHRLEHKRIVFNFPDHK